MNNKTYKKRAVRHGEILLHPVDSIPETASEVYTGDNYVVAHSETGHSHIAVGDLTILRDGESMFLRVNKKSLLKHNKSFDFHKTVTLEKGDYEIKSKNQYDLFGKIQTKVRD